MEYAFSILTHGMKMLQKVGECEVSILINSNLHIRRNAHVLNIIGAEDIHEHYTER